MRLQIIGVVFLFTMLYLASQGDRHKNRGMTQTEKRNIEEAETARQVAHIKERDRKKELERYHPSPRAQNLGDGTHGDIPIGNLMEGLRGFL